MVRIILSLLLIFQPNVVHAQSVNSPVQGDYALGLMKPDSNFIINPIAEKNAFGKTVSGSSTASRDTDAADQLFGKASWLYDATAQNEYIEFSLKTITHPAQDGSCAAYVVYKGDASKYKLQILDGSANSLSYSPLLSSVSVWTWAEATYPCGSSRKVRFVQTESGDGAAVNIGVMYGLNQNIGSVSQATFIGSAYYDDTASCTWTNTGTTPDAFGTTAACPGPTVDQNPGPGVIQTTDANLPQFTVNDLPPGRYRVTISGVGGSTSAAFPAFSINDGTNTRGRATATSTAGGSSQFFIEAWFEYTTTANRTFAVFGTTDAGTQTIYNNANDNQLWFHISRFPAQSEQVVRMSQSNFDWTTCPTITGGFNTNVTYTCKWKRQSSNALFDIGLAFSGAPNAATATVNLPITIDTSKLASVTGSRTIPESTGTVEDSGTAIYTARVLYSSTTAVVLAAQNSSNTYLQESNVTNTLPFSIGNGDYAKLTFSVPVVGWEENQNAPLLAGGMTSNYTGTLKTIIATLNCDGASAITNQSGTTANGIASIGNISAGACAVTFASGTFTSTPIHCEPNAIVGDGANDTLRMALTGAVTTSGFTVDCDINSSTDCTTWDATVMCVGPQ